MTTTLDKTTDNTGVLTITLQESDYQPQVNDKLKKMARSAVIPGFRPGKTPMGILKKMYGHSLAMEEVNSLLSEALNSYISTAEFYALGEPIPIPLPDTGDITRAFPEILEFKFEIGFVNEFEAPVSSDIVIPYYIIPVNEEFIEEELMRLRKRHSTMEVSQEISGPNDVLTGDMEIGEKKMPDVYLSLDTFSEEEVKPFLGLKTEERITISADKLPDLLLKTDITIIGLTEEDKEEILESKGDLTFTVTGVSQRKPAEMNEEFFMAASDNPDITTEEDFRAELKETVISDNERVSNQLLNLLIEQYYLKNIPLSFPEDFLRKSIKLLKEGIPDERVDDELSELIIATSWDLILLSIGKEQKITVSHEEIFEATYRMALDKFGFSQDAPFQEKILRYVESYLTDKDDGRRNSSNMAHLVGSKKIMSYIKETVTIDRKEVTIDELSKRFEETSQFWTDFQNTLKEQLKEQKSKALGPSTYIDFTDPLNP